MSKKRKCRRMCRRNRRRYAYAFDNVGNRSTATEAGTQFAYVTNELNQYSGIASPGEATFQSLVENPSEENFSPAYDADGNATLIRTSTGTWSIAYNGENRPIRFENAATQTVVECAYDSQGRRFEKKVTVAGTLMLHERYVYDGYLQIAAFDVSTDAEGTESFTLKRVIFWDPEEPTATRPLAINVLGDNLYFPTVDLTKNVCELVDFYGDVAATYDYAPFGAVSAGTPAGTAVPANPFQWSSEVYDSELGLVYYNYRHYSPTDGRWLSRDPIEEEGGRNLYAFVKNSLLDKTDLLGQKECLCPCSDYSKTRWKGGLTWEGRSCRTKPGHNPSVNGCGPENGFLNTGMDIVPDSFFGKVFFYSACNIHDRCYGQICESSPERKRLCDEGLFHDMTRACVDAFHAGRISFDEREVCEKQALIYYNAVSSMGGGAFEEAQDEACVWEECKLF